MQFLWQSCHMIKDTSSRVGAVMFGHLKFLISGAFSRMSGKYAIKQAKGLPGNTGHVSSMFKINEIAKMVS